MCKCGWLGKLSKVLLIIGGINWGLVGLGVFFSANWNIVNLLLGFSPTIEAIVYILVGVAGVINVFSCRCKSCKVQAPSSNPMQ